MVAAVAFYVLAAVGSLAKGQGAWMSVPACYHALPVDWLTAGAGGAALGCWIAERMHESRFLDFCEEQEEGE